MSACVAKTRRSALARSTSSASRGEVGRDQVLEEDGADLVRRLVVDHAIRRDRAAERGLRIGRQRFAERVGDRFAQAQPAQVAVLDDGHGRST